MQALKDIFVPYEIAQKLKEIRFNEPCLFYYSWKDKIHCLIPNRTEQTRIIGVIEIDNHNANESEDPFCSAPTYEQVFKWFREKMFDMFIKRNAYRPTYFFEIHQSMDKTDIYMRKIISDFYPTYEEAREQLILKLIEIYEQNNKVPSLGQ